MKKFFFIALAVLFVNVCFSQESNYKSIHQLELEKYNSIGISADEYSEINSTTPLLEDRTTKDCNLNKIVFGWHPYWSNGLDVNYDYNLMSDLSFFSYEVDAATGNADNTHGWATSTVVDDAIAAGVRVNLCVTLFSDHATFFGNSTSMQTLIDNLIGMVLSKGAHGVNIDFEGVSSSLSGDFTSFLIDLCTQMHAQIPGSQVSVCTYAVDWGDLFDEAAIDPYIDLYTIMGYAYYYSGSSEAGPTAPLYTFAGYNYNLARTVNYYLAEGASKDKLVLGLPYYGHEWNTTSSSIPGTTTSSVSSRTYKTVRNNTSGNYSTRLWDENSLTPYYVYNSGNWRQCFCDDEESLGYRYDLVNMTGIAGIGIWALGYDDGYAELWDLIQEKFTDCGTIPCTNTIYDLGGPNRVYFDDSDYTYTIAPTGASQVDLEFVSFDIEAGLDTECNYDYIELFDGPDIGSPSLGKFCNTNGSPGTISSTGGSLTLHFYSDGATANDGFEATWTCVQDNTSPTTEISAADWQTDDFDATFTDNDNEAIDKRFYQVLDWDGQEWRANGDYGFVNDNFNIEIHSDWVSPDGTWSINLGHLLQTNEVSSNTNIYADVVQESGNIYMYHYQTKISGSGGNRRAGIHFFCSDPTQTGREDSYMVYLRADNNTVQIYKYIDNSYSTGWYTTDACEVNADQWYDVKIILNTNTGLIEVYKDDVLVASATDDDPLVSGTAISLRTGECNVEYDDIKVYKSRTETETILVGIGEEVRYQNQDESTSACRLKSIVQDDSNNFSSLEGIDINIDWTSPENISEVNDGPGVDIDTTYVGTELTGNWAVALEPNSSVDYYEYCIGLTPGANNVVIWTNNGTSTSVTHTDLSLSTETIYYFAIRAVNIVGLTTAVTSSSDGIRYIDPAGLTIADFTVTSENVCEGSPVEFVNLSQNANSFLWTITGPQNEVSTEENPNIVLMEGEYDVKLVAYGDVLNDSLTLTINVFVDPLPISYFSALETSLALPSAIAYFENDAQNGVSYSWDFGDGGTSTGFEPWHEYMSIGVYTVELEVQSSSCGSDTETLVDYIIVVDPTESSVLNAESISIFPNPASETLFIKTGSVVHKVSIVSMDGKVCYSEILESNNVEIDLDCLSESNYMLVVETENGKIVKRIVILK